MYAQVKSVVCFGCMASVTASGLVGCGITPRSRFFVLTSQQGVGSGWEDSGVPVGIAPVDLPDYLDRPQIVTRAGEHELRLAELERWAEPLEENVSRVIVDDLRILLGSKEVYLIPGRASAVPSYRVELTVSRFDGSVDGEVILEARWSIFREESASASVTQISMIRESVTGADRRSIVPAMNRALSSLNREIAEAIRSLEG